MRICIAMKTKLLLEETETTINEVPEEKIIEFNISSFVTELIKNKWEQVDNINGMLMTAPNLDDETRIILQDVVSDEYLHIGQLEKIVQNINPEAIALETGANEEVIK